MAMESKGKTALVAGGGSGIGRASALALAAQGATVTGRTRATLEETVQLIRESGGVARFIVADVQDQEVAKAAVAL